MKSVLLFNFSILFLYATPQYSNRDVHFHPYVSIACKRNIALTDERAEISGWRKI